MLALWQYLLGVVDVRSLDTEILDCLFLLPSFAVAVKEAMDINDFPTQESVEFSNAGGEVEYCTKLLDEDYTASQIVKHENENISSKLTSPKATSIGKHVDASVFSCPDTIDAPTTRDPFGVHQRDGILVFDTNEHEHYPCTVQNNHRDGSNTVNFDNGYINQINLERKDWTVQNESGTDSIMKS